MKKMMSALLAWNAFFVVNLTTVWTLRSDITAGADDCLWSSEEDGLPCAIAAKDRHGTQRLIEVLLRSQADRVRRRRRQQQHQQQQETLLSSPDGDVNWSTNGDSSKLEATPTGLALELSTLLRRLRDLPQRGLPSTTDEGGFSADSDLYGHLSKYPRSGLGQLSRNAEELNRLEKRKRRPTKTAELDPTFMLMGIGRK